jgi:hypothetical protein
MKLICTEQEINQLLSKKILEPGNELGSYQLNLKNTIGKNVLIPVELDKVKKDEMQPSLDLRTKKDKGHKDVEVWINEWRAKWRGTRKQGMGNRSLCITNIKEFFTLFPEYSKEDVFQARDKYFADLNGDYTYLEQADYFIKKRVADYDNGGFKTRRTLLTYCEELKALKELGVADEDLIGSDIYDDL